MGLISWLLLCGPICAELKKNKFTRESLEASLYMLQGTDRAQAGL